MKYPDFSDAVTLCIKAGRMASCGKLDMSRAFRNVPMNKISWRYLELKAEHPITGKTYYFVDKCLPFGASISCKIFQDFSDSVAFLVKYQTKMDLVNYLDDYFFVAFLKEVCDEQITVFLNICKEINFPVALEKTFWGTTILTFLGLLLDTENQVVCIPLEKLNKAMEMVLYFINKASKKATVLEVQKLTGYLNFLCKCVVPGRAFTRRMYSIVSSKMKPHHHVRISPEFRMDLLVWEKFLQHPTVFCCPFLEVGYFTADDIDMYSDAAKHAKKGFGAYCDKSWTFGIWGAEFMDECQPSIQYLELYGVTAAVLLWIRRFKNKKICLFCDNDSVVKMINKGTSKCKQCMVLIRIITLECMIQNVRVFAKWVATDENGKADALSRMDFKRFWELDDSMEAFPTTIPNQIWPVEKIWLK